VRMERSVSPGLFRLLRAVGAGSLATLVAFALSAAAAPGQLDPNFSGDGWVRTLEVRGSKAYLPRGAEDVAIQGDGKFAVAGEIQDGISQMYFGVFRYMLNGDLDRSFGEGGWVATDLGSFEVAHAVAIQGDGKIVAAGETLCERAVCFGIVRYNEDGTLDRGFGTGGVVRTMFAQCGCWAYDVAVQPNGRIVAVGRRFRYGDAQDDGLFAVARYLPDGRLDPTFSRDGRASLDFGFGDDAAQAMALYPDGKILVAGAGTRSRYRTQDDFAFARFRPNGTLDRGFSGDGLQTVDFGRRRLDFAYSVDIQRDGRILAAGSSTVGPRNSPSMAVLRLNRNGTLDKTFGAGGKQLTRPVVHGGYARAVRQQPNGRILIAGRAFEDARHDTSDWVIARYRSRGGLDRSFGDGGIVVTSFGTGADWAGALALQRDGKIAAAGSIYESQGLARFLAR
jgi:uncharacterized delta-60 repeat protein